MFSIHESYVEPENAIKTMELFESERVGERDECQGSTARRIEIRFYVFISSGAVFNGRSP